MHLNCVCIFDCPNDDETAEDGPIIEIFVACSKGFTGFQIRDYDGVDTSIRMLTGSAANAYEAIKKIVEAGSSANIRLEVDPNVLAEVASLLFSDAGSSPSEEVGPGSRMLYIMYVGSRLRLVLVEYKPAWSKEDR